MRIRDSKPGDEAAANEICLRTGDHGADGTPFYADDPDALGRIYTEPYLKFAPEFALMLEDDGGICGYAFGALDSRAFFERYERDWRPRLCAQFPEPTGDRTRWSRAQHAHYQYHHPDYYCPEPYDLYPSHAHIDLLPCAQGLGYGRKLMEALLGKLKDAGSPGVHLGMSAVNHRAYGFYRKLGFEELARDGEGSDQAIYMGVRFTS